MTRTDLKNGILINCISFTVVSVILALLSYIPGMMMELTRDSFLQLFACTTLISLLTAFTVKIRIDSILLLNLILFMESMLVIYLLGGVAPFAKGKKMIAFRVPLNCASLLLWSPLWPGRRIFCSAPGIGENRPQKRKGLPPCFWGFYFL